MAKVVYKNKRKMAVFLILLFVVFCIASYKMQSEAIAPVVGAVAVAGVALCASALVAYGVAFIETGDMQEAAEQMYSDFNTRIDNIITAGRLIWNYTEQGYKYVVTLTEDLAADIQTWVNTNYDVGVNEIVEQSITEIPVVDGDYILTPAMNTLPITINYNRNGTDRILTITGTQEEDTYYDVHIEIYYNGAVQTEIDLGDIEYMSFAWDETMQYYRLKLETYLHQVHQYGMYDLQSVQSNYYAVVGQAVGAEGIVDNGVYDWANTYTGEKDIPIDIGNDIPQVVDPDDEYGPDIIWVGDAGTIIGLTLPQLEDLIRSLLNKDASDVVSKDVTGTEIEDTEINEDEISTELSEDYQPSQAEEHSIKALVVSKFPFCIPWDIKNAITLIAAQPVAPHFEIDIAAPFVGEGVGVISFDFNDYALIGTICRWFSTIEFCLLLAAATKKLIWG